MKSAEEEVFETHKIFWQGLTKRDLAMRFSVCSEDITFFGTGHHEHAIGKEQLMQMSEQSLLQYPDPFEINIGWIKVRVIGHVACVECDTIWVREGIGKPIKEQIRLTTILKKVDKKWLVFHVHGSEPDYRLPEGQYSFDEITLERNRELEKQVFNRTKELHDEKLKSDNLLLNILPEEIAKELKETGKSLARSYDMVTVMFTDFKDFTYISEKLSPEELVTELDYCFRHFDEIITKHKLEKIKTIGDSYMCAGGIPVINPDHAENTVNAALEIRNFMLHYKKEREAKGELAFEIRIGINSGPVVAGIVGITKFAYDIWGDTVNTASQMEQNCEIGKVNISEATYSMVKDKFKCVCRGEINAKHKGKLKMYFAETI